MALSRITVYNIYGFFFESFKHFHILFPSLCLFDKIERWKHMGWKHMGWKHMGWKHMGWKHIGSTCILDGLMED